jgi:hypothetical protein
VVVDDEQVANGTKRPAEPGVRYEHASTVLTSNKGFEEWGDTFQRAVGVS